MTTKSQGDLFDLSRTKDPDTSKAAGNAQKPGKRTELQQRILRAFAVMGDMHDQHLLEQVHIIERNLGFAKLSSPSGVRSRRAELSKPNMDRIGEHVADVEREHKAQSWPLSRETALTVARGRLAAEGFRSPLWDTGKRETVNGYNVIVWGLAK